MSHISATDFLKKATNTAHHFGFSPVDRIKRDSRCKACPKRVDHKSSAVDRRTDALHGMLTSGMCSYFDHKLNGIEGPVLFYSTDQVPRSGEAAISLQVYNVEKSIAEALLIQTIRSLLADLGKTDYSVRVNSLGDQDSVARYVRELTNYLRKHIDTMPGAARELMKDHVFHALMHLIEKEHELAEKSPNPLEYLTDQSRKHFREIVEYLDMSEVPYEIDPLLIGHHQCYSDALFAFDVHEEESPLLIRGGRYNSFVSRMSRTNTPAAGAVIVLRDKKAPARTPAPRAPKNPAAYIVQLGFGPKIKSLLLLNELRQAGIPVLQNIVSDSLSEQLRDAESQRTKYAIIIGQKEYIEGNVILRNLEARTQENIPTDRLIAHLKRVHA